MDTLASNPHPVSKWLVPQPTCPSPVIAADFGNKSVTAPRRMIFNNVLNLACEQYSCRTPSEVSPLNIRGRRKSFRE